MISVIPYDFNFNFGANISQGGFGARPAISMDGLPPRTAEKKKHFLIRSLIADVIEVVMNLV